MQPTPYIDEQTGQRFYNVRQAAQIIAAISETTLWGWAKHGSTPFGFDLDIQSEPVTQHRRPLPKNPREVRLLIPEDRVYALKDILADHPRRPGPLSRNDMSALEAAARRFRLPLRHRGNSPAL